MCRLPTLFSAFTAHPLLHIQPTASTLSQHTLCAHSTHGQHISRTLFSCCTKIYTPYVLLLLRFPFPLDICLTNKPL